MTSAYSINLNFNNTIPVKTDFTFKQGDKGITFNLATVGLDTTGTTAHIVFKRSNGTSVEAELTGQTGPSYSYTILGNEFEIPGVVVADLKLYNGDTQRVSTASFIFLVTGDTMDGVGGGTGGYSDQLEELSQEFSDTLEEYKDAFGDVGAVNPRGAYDSTVDYNVLDLVSYQGSSYLCRTACKNKVPTNTTYWQIFASGSGGVDYNDVSNKPSINSVTLSGDKTTADLGLFSGNYNDLTNKPAIPSDFDDLADVDMTGVTDGQVPTWDATAQKYKPGTPAGGGGGTNPNLLINPWFTVNQRGSSTYTANTYTVDRWQKGTNGQVDVVSDGLKITLTSNCYLSEIFEDDLKNYLVGKTVTVSLAVVSVSGSITIDISDGNTRQTIPSSNKLTFTVQSGFTGVNFRFQGSGYIIIRAVKLEIGSASTLHLDTAPDYTTELLKCQRYFFRWQTGVANTMLCFAFVEDATTARLIKDFPVPMRAVPTMTYAGSFKLRSSAGNDYTISAISQNTGTIYQNMITITSTGMSVGTCRFIAYSGSDYLDFSAEL